MWKIKKINDRKRRRKGKKRNFEERGGVKGWKKIDIRGSGGVCKSMWGRVSSRKRGKTMKCNLEKRGGEDDSKERNQKYE